MGSGVEMKERARGRSDGGEEGVREGGMEGGWVNKQVEADITFIKKKHTHTKKRKKNKQTSQKVSARVLRSSAGSAATSCVSTQSRRTNQTVQ